MFKSLSSLRIIFSEIAAAGRTLSSIGHLLIEMGEFTKALEAFKKSLKLNPKYAPAWQGLGKTYGRLGDRTKVMDVYQTLKVIHPQAAGRFFNEVVLP